MQPLALAAMGELLVLLFGLDVGDGNDGRMTERSRHEVLLLLSHLTESEPTEVNVVATLPSVKPSASLNTLPVIICKVGLS